MLDLSKYVQQPFSEGRQKHKKQELELECTCTPSKKQRNIVLLCTTLKWAWANRVKSAMVGSGSAQWWHYSVGESVEIISCVIWPAAIRSQLSALLWSHQSGHPAYHTNPLSANNFYNFEQKSQFWSSLPKDFGRFSYSHRSKSAHFGKNISVTFSMTIWKVAECWPEIELREAWTTFWAWDMV